MKSLKVPARLLAVAAMLWVVHSDTLPAQTNTLLVGPTSLSFTFQTGGGVPGPQNLSVLSSGASVTFTLGVSTIGPQGWLLVTPDRTITPATLSVAVSPTGLAPGAYVGTITITSAAAANSPVQIVVSLSVVTSSQVNASPSSLSFSFQVGGAVPAAQTLSLSSTGSPLSFTLTPTVVQGGGWLVVNPLGGATPATVTVGINPGGLSPGTYTGTVNVAASGATNSPIAVPVTLTVSSTPLLTATPSALRFNFQTGGSVPPNQALSILSSGAALNFNVSSPPSAPWLVVGAFSGTTPSTINIAVNPSGLAPGIYNASVTITSAGASNSPLAVPVTLVVSVNPLLNVSPGSLSFSFQTGGANPANQALTLTSTGAALNFTAATTTASWLVIGPLSGLTTGSVTVAVNPAGLAPGVYTGSVTLSASGANTVSVPVALTVTTQALLNVNPASLSFGFQIGFGAPPSQTVTVTSAGAPLSFTLAATTSSGGPWLSIASAGVTTPATFSVLVNPAGLAAGTYTGSITVTPAGAGSSPVTVPVTLIVSNTALIIASPSALAFTVPAGSTTLVSQAASLTTTDSTLLNFTVNFSTTSGGPWLLVSPSSGTTPSNLTVVVNPTGLAAGTYTGSIVVTAPSAPNSPQTISITLTIAPTASLTATPGALSFSQATGGPVPAAQTLSLATSGGVLDFFASASTVSGGPWLSVVPPSGTAPGTLSVAVNGTGLSPGTYNGTITIVAPGAANSPLNIQVSFTVSAQPLLSVAPAGLSFSFQIGSATPPPQTIAVSAGGAATLNFTAQASVAGGGPWLAVGPANGATPATLSVSVNPAGLTAGTYAGVVTIAATGASNSPQVVNVSLTVTAAVVSPSVGAVVNAASFLPTAVAPGLLITIFGSDIGPVTPASLRLTANGLVDTRLADTRVLFDDTPSPMVYASSGQVSAIVPYAMSGRNSARLQIEFQGARSPSIDLKVVDTAPGIFTLTSTGTGQGAILNENFTVNGVNNPAARGSIVMIYATGEGQTNPTGVDGLITGSILRQPLQRVSVTIGGQTAEVLYNGAAPTLVAGVLQVNARVPAGIAPGNAVPVVLTIGGASSSPGVTMAVR